MECVVALFLLAIVSIATAATTRGTLALSDDSALVTHAQALAVTGAEDALTMPCATNASGTDLRPRIESLWQQTSAGPGTLVHLELTLERSPIASAVNPFMQLALDGGGVCP